MKKLILALVVVLAGCATAGKINRVSLGQTKDQVIALMGAPDSSKAANGVEVLVYSLSDTDNDAFYGNKSEYWVTIEGGKVTKYGRAGDFGTADRSAASEHPTTRCVSMMIGGMMTTKCR